MGWLQVRVSPVGEEEGYRVLVALYVFGFVLGWKEGGVIAA